MGFAIYTPGESAAYSFCLFSADRRCNTLLAACRNNGNKAVNHNHVRSRHGSVRACVCVCIYMYVQRACNTHESREDVTIDRLQYSSRTW